MYKKLCYKEEFCGYMTVEATLILSIVFMVYLFLIHSFMWIYDRCVLDMDMAALTLRCVNTTQDRLEQVWQHEVKSLDMEKYLWLELREPLLQKQGWKYTVTGQGEDKQFGKCGVVYEVWKFIPENWLRINRKLEQGKEKEEGESSK